MRTSEQETSDIHADANRRMTNRERCPRTAALLDEFGKELDQASKDDPRLFVLEQIVLGLDTLLQMGRDVSDEYEEEARGYLKEAQAKGLAESVGYAR